VAGGGGTQLVVTTDRTSNAPLVVYPGARRPGGAPETEEWQLDNFACDPVTSESMLATAERVARQGAFDKGELDELAARRYEQYLDALSAERAFQREWMIPIRAGSSRHPTLIEEDWGVRPVQLDELRRLAPVIDGGVLSYGTQTHPADGSAGVVLTTAAEATAAGVDVLARVLATGFARVAPGEMPKATVPAARRALQDAGVDIGQVDVIKTHNPFAVNDLWLARELGVDAWKINPFGSSLIYGHPQGPTGMRGIVELIHALRARGGGLGLFTGCAAGDTGAAVVVGVDG
jgi:acetyl-CoA acetyltransferase